MLEMCHVIPATHMLADCPIEIALLCRRPLGALSAGTGRRHSVLSEVRKPMRQANKPQIV